MSEDENYDGPERRKDDPRISVRLSLLEDHAKVNKDNIEKLHNDVVEIREKQVEIKEELTSEFRIGIQNIFDKLDAQKKLRDQERLAYQERKDKECKECIELVNVIRNNVSWLDRWVLALSAGLISLGGFFFKHQDKIK